MPTYEFRCPAGHDFERFYRKISDGQATVECPECGQMAERRMSAGAGLLFKGSGFYITDYGKDGKKDQRAASKPAGESSGTTSAEAPAPKSESKAESAPAAKPAKPAESKKSSSNE